MYSTLKWSYTDFAEEFGVLVPNWANLEGYVTDAIIRDASNRGNEFWRFWENDPKFTENGRIRAITAFVKNYIEVVESLDLYTPTGKEYQSAQKWRVWGITLRLLEIGD